MRIGYARVSSNDQNLSLQLSELKAAGCEHVYREKITGTNAARPQLQKMMGNLRPGDVIVVCKLDRMARNTSDLLALVGRIVAAEARFLSVAEPWADTTSPAGELMLTIFAGFAQFEVGRMKERCADGTRAAKARGVKFGRKDVLTQAQKAWALTSLKEGQPATTVAQLLNVSVRTIYRFKRTIAA